MRDARARKLYFGLNPTDHIESHETGKRLLKPIGLEKDR